METNEQEKPMTLLEGEEPLVGLLRPDLSTYSMDDLMKQVTDIRTLRSSPQTRAARMEARVKKDKKVVSEKESSETKARREALMDDLMD